MGLFGARCLSFGPHLGAQDLVSDLREVARANPFRSSTNLTPIWAGYGLRPPPDLGPGRGGRM